ncbi:MAG: methylenetetrahydrofolate reductase [Bdellovibrionota bacterium]
MTPLPFKPDRKLTDVLATSKFTLSAEVIPPRNGSEQNILLNQINLLIQAGAQFLAVTKGAGGSLRGGSLPIAQAIKENFNVPCIAHFTCRDLTPAEVENQLMDHHYFGIRNILALRGDPPEGEPEWKARSDGGYNHAHELISQIVNLNNGKYIPRATGLPAGKQEATDFCIGAAVYPEFPDPVKRLEYFEKKIKAGAMFGITDMLFDTEAYGRFLDSCEKGGLSIPVLPGTRLLRSKSHAMKMASRFRVKIPAEMLASLPETHGPDGAAPPKDITKSVQDGDKIGVEIFLKQVERLRALGAPGVHLFVIFDTIGAVTALKALSSDFSGINH